MDDNENGGGDSDASSDDADALRPLKAPDYTDEEKRRIFNYVASLVVPQLRAFLKKHELPVGGTKSELRQRLREKVASGAISYADLVELLDQTEPWNKQHVFLLDGPEDGPEEWRNEDGVKALGRTARKVTHPPLGK